MKRLDNFYCQPNTIAFGSAEKIDKGWGHELEIYNCREYCAKILWFKAGAKGSFHFHATKHETWYIRSGTGNLWYKNKETGDTVIKSFKSGDVIDIPRFCSHRVEAVEEVEIFEVSTQHFDSDTYRISPGDSQKKQHE